MRFITIDFETYSETDIKSAGAFRYMEDPNFELLLMAYAYDDEEVKLVDFASGEDWPEGFKEALVDPDVLKIAHNAAFEREAIRQAVGIYSPPEQWLDTMHVAAQCGLPLSLDGVGKALGFDEETAKMKKGKALIRYFCCPCKPTKVNGGRTRNLPEHAPEKWETFKDYCLRDVVAERAIYKTLLKWTPNDTERKLWCLDAKINEKGVRIDKQLAAMAVAMDRRYKEELTEKAVAITGLENPKSVSQIKNWLFDQEGKEFPSLNKKVIADVVAQLETEEARQFMNIRSELSKSSTAKYEAMMRVTCSDDHAKGCFTFYGANRTGRWCLTGDHEVLTPTGWMRMGEWDGGRIAVWSPQSGQISFQKSESVNFPYEGEMVHIDAQRCQQVSTLDHKMAVLGKNGEWTSKNMGELYGKRFQMPFTGTRSRDGYAMSDDELRVLIMVQADGHYTDDGDIKLGFTKTRKVERCKHLLRRAGIPFLYAEHNDSRCQFTIKRRNQPIWLRQFRGKTFGWWMLDENPHVIVDELERWDGYRCGPNSIQYTTTNKQNAEVIQAVCQLSGLSSTLLVKERGDDHPNWNDAYILNIWLTPGASTGIRGEQMSKRYFNGTVYCASTPTGFFLVRRNGVVWITGNSGKHIQFQNMSKNEMPDLEACRTLVRNGKYTAVKSLYDGVSKPLSELVRTAIIPEEGHHLLVSDFSAIEARVIAWFADEKWRLQVFEDGGDIYCQSASQMFKVPVVKHGENGHLRQKGKVAELACGYGGGVGALKAFGADKMGMSEEEMQETVDMWREASPKIVQMWWDIGKAAARSITRRGHVDTQYKGVSFDFEGGILWMNLPSGRSLAYFGAKYEASARMPGKMTINYRGVDQQTKRWTKVETYGPKLVENLVQATARDCLREAMLALDEAGYDIRGHVHDEVIVTEPINGRSVDEMSELMGAEIPWAPGLPLRADGYACNFYMKD